MCVYELCVCVCVNNVCACQVSAAAVWRPPSCGSSYRRGSLQRDGHTLHSLIGKGDLKPPAGGTASTHHPGVHQGCLIVDEMSTVGRKQFGKVDGRLRQEHMNTPIDSLFRLLLFGCETKLEHNLLFLPAGLFPSLQVFSILWSVCCSACPVPLSFVAGGG